MSIFVTNDKHEIVNVIDVDGDENVQLVIGDLKEELPVTWNFTYMPILLIPDNDWPLYGYDPASDTVIKLPIPFRVRVFVHQITDYYFELDNSPVTMDGHTVDANPNSLLKMDELSLFIGDDQLIEWTMADNSTYIFTGSEFKTFTTRVKKGHLKRAYNLHAHAKILKALLPDVFEEDLVESKWPMDTTIDPQAQGLCFL